MADRPSAMIPFAIAAGLRSAGTPAQRGVAALLVAALVVAAAAIVVVPLIWLAVALALLGVRQSRPSAPGAMPASNGARQTGSDTGRAE